MNRYIIKILFFKKNISNPKKRNDRSIFCHSSLKSGYEKKIRLPSIFLENLVDQGCLVRTVFQKD